MGCVRPFLMLLSCLLGPFALSLSSFVCLFSFPLVFFSDNLVAKLQDHPTAIKVRLQLKLMSFFYVLTIHIYFYSSLYSLYLELDFFFSVARFGFSLK